MGKCDCYECTCREAHDHNTCGECHEEKITAPQVISGVMSILFFWHVFFLEILMAKRVQKELTKHPEKLIQAMLEAMTQGGAQ